MELSCCWLYAISKYGYPPTLEDAVRAMTEMAEMGFRHIEMEGVGEANLREVYEARHALKRRADELGVDIVNFCPVLPDLVSLDDRRRRAAVGLFDLAVDCALAFGRPTLQIDSFTPPLRFAGEAPYSSSINYGQAYKVEVDPHFRWEDQWAALVESVKACNRKAKDAGLRLCLEPRVGEIISNTDAMLRLLEAVGDQNFGAVLDTGHQHAQKEILPLSVEKLGSRIFYLHASDNDGKENQHLAVGRGTVDWEGLFKALRKHGFDGYVAVDIGGVPVAELDAQYLESKAFLEELFGRLGMQ